jgi:hypothetical protein
MPATPQAQTPPSSNDPDTWTIADAVALRSFVSENPKFIRVLAKRRPKIEGDTMESRAVTGSDVKGFLDCMDVIDALQRDPDATNENAGFIA